MNVAIILAGGSGIRFGATDGNGRPMPKQFVEVFGEPILIYTIEAFQEDNNIDAIEVVCIHTYKKLLQELILKFNLTKVKWIADGGKDFQESVFKGLIFLSHDLNFHDIVLIHFGVSPFITPKIIDDCIRVTKEKGNAISTIDFLLLPGIKHKETSVTDPDNYSQQFVDRDSLACMNSPHGFRFGYVLDLYNRAYSSGVINFVEPHTTSLMYKMGEKVYFSFGMQSNIKITRQEDLLLFEAYIFYKKSKQK
jgi:2-C-methyl-D-erythritol 4-phosphate cytidylyltransferase